MSELQKLIKDTEDIIQAEKLSVRFLKEKSEKHCGAGESDYIKAQLYLNKTENDLQTLQAIKAEFSENGMHKESWKQGFKDGYDNAESILKDTK